MDLIPNRERLIEILAENAHWTLNGQEADHHAIEQFIQACTVNLLPDDELINEVYGKVMAIREGQFAR